MSGSLNGIYNNTSFALNLHYEAMARLQEQAYTGSRINRVSDDPSTAYRVMGLDSQKKSLENYMSSIAEASSVLDFSSSVINDITSAITDTKVQLTQITSGTYNEDGRQRFADQINDTLERVVSLANTQHLGQYIFGGSNTTSPPFSVTRDTDGNITDVIYQGGSQQRDVQVAPGVQSNAYHVGKDIFGSDNRSAPEFHGETGAALGTGTSSVKGDNWLTITGTAGNYTLSLDGGIAVTGVDGSDANLALTDANGRVLYVDTTNITGTGVEMIRVPGTYDIFNSLISGRGLMENEKGLPETQLAQCRGQLANSLNEVNNHLTEKMVSVGSKIGFLDDLKNSLEDMKFNTSDEATLLQEADIAQVAIDISRREVLYQMSLSVSAKIMSMSLLDFIR